MVYTSVRSAVRSKRYANVDESAESPCGISAGSGVHPSTRTEYLHVRACVKLVGIEASPSSTSSIDACVCERARVRAVTPQGMKGVWSGSARQQVHALCRSFVSYLVALYTRTRARKHRNPRASHIAHCPKLPVSSLAWASQRTRCHTHL